MERPQWAPAFAASFPSETLTRSPRQSIVGASTFCNVYRPVYGVHSNGIARRTSMSASYLDTSTIEIDWRRPERRGSFGKVWFGVETNSGADIVVKCPIDTDKARTLLNVEEHTNSKLVSVARKRPDIASSRWAEYLGKIIVPRDADLASGVSRIGLVWRRVGSGETLEDYLQNDRIPELGETMKVGRDSGRLRLQLAETVLVELIELLVSLGEVGIVHRDIKPDNIVVDPTGTSPLRCIDFGSSCDWGSPFKKGLLTATCDPYVNHAGPILQGELPCHISN